MLLRATQKHLWTAIESLHTQLIENWIGSELSHVSLNQVWPSVEALYNVRAELVDLCFTELADSEDVHEMPMRRLHDRVQWAFHKINQFDRLEESAQSEVKTLTANWVLTLDADASEISRWTDHLNVVSDNYLWQLNQYAHKLNKSSRRITSEQYSAALQLQVLRLEIGMIRDPVLDIGCGREGTLVQWLRRSGKKAAGIDLFVDSVPGCLVMDWFEARFPPAQFGTIIAHLSFSLHFLKHHLDPLGHVERYAQHYMNILRSLQVGGQFTYVPGLPFIEELLPPETYGVTRFSIEEVPRDIWANEIFSQYIGADPIYCCHVERKS